MKKNAKTVLFLLVIVGFSVFLLNSSQRDVGRARERFAEVSEDFSQIYKRKTYKVYRGIDQGSVLSPVLEKMVQEEATKEDFSQFKKWPVVSLWIDPVDLYSKERGIIKNGQKRGRLWERRAYLTYHKQGQKLFSSYVGIRLHGGAGRRENVARRSFRVYFRKSYGEKEFLRGEGLTLKPNTPVKIMILRDDRKFYFGHDFGFDLVKTMGGLAPSIVPIRLYLNGEFYGYQFMTEHPGQDQLKYYFGHSNFLVYKLKKEDNDSQAHLSMEDAIARALNAPKPLSLAEMKKIVDIQGMTASIMTVLFTGMTDWGQGTWIKDLKSKDSVWKWLVWDYDNAFFDDQERIPRKLEHPWDAESFHTVMEFHGGLLMTKIFRRLIQESSEYREYFKGQFNQLFDVHLAPEQVQKKFSSYYEYAQDAGNDKKILESLKHIRDFIQHRKPVFCRHMKETLGEEAQTCHR